MCSLTTMRNDLSEFYPKWKSSQGQRKCGDVSISIETQFLTIHCMFCEVVENTLEYFLEHLKQKHFSMLAVETIFCSEPPTNELHIKQEEIELNETKLQDNLNVAFESATDPLVAEEKILNSCIFKTEVLESVEVPGQRVDSEKPDTQDEADNQLSFDAEKPKFQHICKLIHYIQAYPTLWDTQLAVHYIRSERMSAVESITKQFLQEYPNLSIDAKYVHNKFRDLKTIYYNYNKSKTKPNKNYEKYFDLLYFLKDHEKTKENKNLCKVCNKNVACLPRHMQKHHCKNTSNTKYLKCDTCEEILPTAELLQKHVRAIHRRYECKLCTQAPYTNSHSLRRHMESKHPDIPFPKNRSSRGYIKERICERCGRQFKSQQRLYLHINTVHLQLRPYACPDCQKTFKDLKKLKSHRNSAHLNYREHVCDICPKAFFDRKTMLQHKRLHSDVMNYTCRVCSKAFRQAPALHSHMKTHQ